MLDDNMTSNTEETGQLKFIWNICNLYMSESSYRKPIKSPSFYLHSSGVPKYHFELFPNGKTEDEKDKYVSLYLIKSKEKEKLKKVTYKVFLTVKKLSPKAKIPIYSLTNFKLTKQNDAFVIPDHVLTSGDVTLKFEISYDKEMSTKCDFTSSIKDLEEISSAISKTYDDKLHWDTVLYSTGNRFYIHKALVDVRLPKLAEEINKHTNNIVRLNPRIEKSVTECLLRYIYSGKLNGRNIPTGIYDAITIYEISELKPMILSEPKTIFVSTSFKKFSFTLLWKIPNFSKLNSNEIHNYFFIRDNTPPWTWFKVFFCFSKKNGNENEDIVFSIERYSSICKTIICRVKILDQNKTFKNSFNSENLWRMPTFINKSELLENKSKYLPNDELSIDLEIFVSDGAYDSKIDKMDFVPYFENQIPQRDMDLKYLQDFQKLFNNPKFSDVTVATGEDKFYVHKFILSARSPVFYKMFQENKKEHISIIDIDTDVVKSMLKFIYYGEVKIDINEVQSAIRLYSAAFKYEISSLQRKCVQFLKTGLSSENAVGILMVADACCDEDLKQHVNDFICSNPRSVITSKVWEQITGKKDLVLGLLERALTFAAEKK